jgi:large subunit ribosomal protein L18
MLSRKLKRSRRARKTRAIIKQQGAVRLCVTRSSRHIYAQLIVKDVQGDRVLASASSLTSEIKNAGGIGNMKSAALVGQTIAQKTLALNIEHVAYDRSGFLYHGQVKALAEAARDAGLKF